MKTKTEVEVTYAEFREILEAYTEVTHKARINLAAGLLDIERKEFDLQISLTEDKDIVKYSTAKWEFFKVAIENLSNLLEHIPGEK